jgi:hypothetical protein
MYAYENLRIHKTKHRGWKNWIQMEKRRYLKSAADKTTVSDALLYSLNTRMGFNMQEITT